SRRRHTRCLSDWSSDVCSSDLGYAGAVNGNRTLEDKRLSAQISAIELVRKGCTACFDMFTEFPAPTVEGVHAVARAYQQVGVRRSEERRVGKEGRSRWSALDE